MSTPRLAELLKIQFPTAHLPDNPEHLAVGAFPEWDSLAHFNFLLLVEEHFDVRFSAEDMAELKSIASIAAALRQQGISAL